MNKKIIIYQVLPRLFGNRNSTCKKDGTLAENGVGKMNDFDTIRLRKIHEMGFTHVWYTGLLRHATTTDYTQYGIPRQHASVVKGKAGSPYAIVDYYDIDPDLAVDVPNRMGEFEELVSRTHLAGMKVIIDFVPNHVGREYKSINLPAGTRDLGADDNTSKHFDPQNNFYYCPGHQFVSPASAEDDFSPYVEFPAKCTGNDKFNATPGLYDWYETVKLNYGIDYCDAGGRSYHYNPVPDTWKKMTEILLFWAAKGIDGFRCDMAEMVPHDFWAYATNIVKESFPNIIFIGEVYDTNQYRTYVASGFDYLYDKVGMYDCLRDVVCERRPANSITYSWQNTDDIKDHMLYFLENHDEQRIASDFFCGDGAKAIPAFVVAALLQKNPLMIYAGQEVGERGMDEEGFSGVDGRTTIFDYWHVDAVYREFFTADKLTDKERELQRTYTQVLRIANREKAVREGDCFDLMYVNTHTWMFNPRSQYAFLRKKDDDVLLVVVNFSRPVVRVSITIPAHAFDFLGLPERDVLASDLLTGEKLELGLKKDGAVEMTVPPYGAKILKFSIKMKDNAYMLNEHNKDEFPPAHTAEHLLNQLMVRMFGCQRSTNAHIERKKSKMSYVLDHKPTRREEKAIEDEMNRLIEADMPVTYETVDRNHIPEGVSLERLPKDASEMIRLVRIGDYDVCPCIGKHVRSTSQIGKFVLLGTNWDEPTHTFRIRFKVIP
jgi:glycosidase